ncbi:carbohydrate porin [Pseudomonas sp. TE3610]
MTLRASFYGLLGSAVLSAMTAQADELNKQDLLTDYPYYNKDWVQHTLTVPPAENHKSWAKQLYDAGVEYNGLMIGAVFNNISTGARPGHVGGQLIFINAVDLDLAKLFDLPKAKVHIEGVVFPLTYPRQVTGDFGHYASSYLGGDQYPAHDTGNPWLSLLTWEQTLWDDRLNIEVGKLNLQRYFFRPNCGLDFLCTDAVVKWDGGVPDASTGTLGGRVRYNLSPEWALEGGAQQLRDYSALVRQKGWDALASDHGTGTFFVAGLGYRTDFANRAYPEDYQLHFYHADTAITDPYWSVNGTSTVTTTDTASTHRGANGVVMKLRKTVWSDTGKPAATPTEHPRNLALFGTVAHSFDDAKPVDWGITAGATLEKPWGVGGPWFGVDQLEVKAMYARINHSTLLAQRDRRVLLGGSSQMTSPDEYRLELSTTLSLGRYLELQPAIEYIGNPDSSMTSDSANLPRSGWLVGAILAVSFGNAHP